MIITDRIKDIEIEIKVLKEELERLNEKPIINVLKIVEIKKDIAKLEKIIMTYQEQLLKLEGVPARIYYKIIYEGMNITKAVESIAEENFKKNIKPHSNSAIWKYYKKYVKQLLERKK